MSINVSLQKVKDLSCLLIWQEKNLEQLQSYKDKVATGAFKPQGYETNPLLKHIEGADIHGLNHEYFDEETESYEEYELFIDTKDLLELLDVQIIKYHHLVLNTRESLENLINH